MEIEVLPDPLDKWNIEPWIIRLRKGILCWTDNEIDAVPFENKVALYMQPEDSG